MINIQPYAVLIAIIVTTIISSSCTTTSNNHTHTLPAKSLYTTAQTKLSNNNYSSAIQDLLNLQNLHLFEPCAQQTYLDLIYAYYKSNDLNAANNLIKRFLKLYPKHKNLDYILYMHGIINMNLDKNNINPFIKYLHISWFHHDPIYANIAFHSLIKLIKNYPNSQYFFDSYKRLIFLKNRLAEHELSIIKFYNKRNAYISVLTRTEKMLYYFPNTQATYQSLYYAKQAYKNIHLINQALKISNIIDENKITY